MSSPSSPPRRKPPEERRAEIVETAARVALQEGLEKVTARRVAQALAVVPGLITHYFRSADDLVAVAFTHVAANERNVVFAHAEAGATAVEQMRRLIDDWFDMRADPVALLWLDAWQASRRRPALLRAVTEQMQADLERLEALIRAGVDRGQLRVADASGAAFRIMALVDATSVQAAVRTVIDYTPVTDMLLDTTEDTLGLARGALRR